ncbi:MAG: amidoligase family protein, partial [Candidatus Thorarchaeota archaeon]
KNNLLLLEEFLQQYGAEINESQRAGVHVHVNVQPFTFKKTLTYAILYLILEELLVKWCGEDREGNLFCLRASDAEILIHGLTKSVARNSFRTVQDQRYRYASLNMTSLSKYGSLEFRAMRSTADFGAIRTWVEMLLKIKDQSLMFNEPRHIIEAASEDGGQLFVNTIMGEYAELLQCPNMDDIVMDGIRRVQHLVFMIEDKQDDEVVEFEAVVHNEGPDDRIEVELARHRLQEERLERRKRRIRRN